MFTSKESLMFESQSSDLSVVPEDTESTLTANPLDDDILLSLLWDSRSSVDPIMRPTLLSPPTLSLLSWNRPSRFDMMLALASESTELLRPDSI